MSEQRPLHRLFGLAWADFFQGTEVEVEPETDLSLKQQFLDLVLIRRGPGPIPRRLPDGFEDLAAHNLITFKSYQEALDADALWELVGHFVNYRKQRSPALDDLLPTSDFRLFAVSARFPHNLSQEVGFNLVREGVYEVRELALCIRVVVLAQLAQQEHNAMLHLFSARAELLRYGQEHYRPHSRETSTLLYELFRTYSEDPNMPEQLQEFVQQTIDQLLESLPPEKRLQGLSAEELRKRLSTEERLEGLTAEELRKRLSPEERLEGLTAEDLIRTLSPETLVALKRQLKTNGEPPKPE
jgi:hypothetical protein